MESTAQWEKEMVAPAALKVVCLKSTWKLAYGGHPAHHEVAGSTRWSQPPSEEGEGEGHHHHREEKQLMGLWRQAEKSVKNIDRYTVTDVLSEQPSKTDC